MVGSVKTNIGHLEAAAGVAGVLKAALALSASRNPAAPALSHTEPAHRLERDPLRVVTERTAWPDRGRPGLAGVSSFGLSGVNAHVVLEEAPREAPAHEDDRHVHVLPISARSPEALEALVARYGEYLAKSSRLLGKYLLHGRHGARALRTPRGGHSQFGG